MENKIFNKKVSVIVPVWNAHDYLHRCVDSILSQTYKNIEVFLIDDGSNDDSFEMCKDYEVADDRVKAFHKENGGQGSARNFALDRCTGDYIGFVDNDDWIFPTMYERLVEIIEKYDAEVARCDDAQSEAEIEENVIVKEDICEGKEYHRLLFCDIWGGHVTDRLFKKSVIGDRRFPVSKSIEDMRFMREILIHIRKEAHTNEKLYYYTVREDNTSFLMARTYVNTYERAEEYQSRYEEAMIKYPEYCDNLLSKATSFGCGAMRKLMEMHMKDSNEYKKMRSFVKKHKKSILSLKGLSMKYKVFVMVQ